MESSDKKVKSGLNTNGLIFFFWFLYGIIEYVKTGAWTRGTGYLFFYFIPGLLVWVALTFPVRTIFRNTSGLKMISRVPVLLLTVMAAALTKVSVIKLVTFLLYDLSGPDFGKHFQNGIRFFITEATIVASILMTLLFIIEIYNKYKNESLINAKLESELSKAQLQALKMQLQPHFLFNVLNTISNLIRSDQKEKAIDILSNLGELLRYSFKSRNQAVIPLREELDFIRQYLDLEMVRFKENLSIEYQLSDALMELKVPQMILQPIVENAIKHGVSGHLGKARIKISGEVFSDQLRLSIFNTGPGFKTDEWGVGLTNTRDRLEMLGNGRDNRLEINDADQGVVVSIILPLIRQ